MVLFPFKRAVVFVSLTIFDISYLIPPVFLILMSVLQLSKSTMRRQSHYWPYIISLLLVIHVTILFIIGVKLIISKIIIFIMIIVY